MSRVLLTVAAGAAAVDAFSAPSALPLRSAAPAATRPQQTKMQLMDLAQGALPLLAADADTSANMLTSFVSAIGVPALTAAAVSVAAAGKNDGAIASGPMPDITVARENFKRWNDSLQTKDPKQVAALYSGGELSFLPTVSPQHIKNTADTEDYFVAFVQKNPFGTITDDSIQAYGPDAYLHSGMYTFGLGPMDDRTPVEARFSYVWMKINSEWKISHHHSSVRPPTGSPPDINVARENFKRWNDALQTKNPKTVADLYMDGELSFLPTVSPVHIKDTSLTEDYFVAFVQKHPFGTITDDSIQAYGNDAYLHSGMYTFGLGVGAERADVEARFSYVWKKSADGWKITHHHSSVRPEAPKAAPVSA